MAQPGLINNGINRSGLTKPILLNTINYSSPYSQGLEFCVAFDTFNTSMFREAVLNKNFRFGNFVAPNEPQISNNPLSASVTIIDTKPISSPSVNFPNVNTSRSITLVNTLDIGTYARKLIPPNQLNVNNVRNRGIFTMRVKFCLASLPGTNNSTWRSFFANGTAFQVQTTGGLGGSIDTGLFMGVNNNGFNTVFGASDNGNSTYHLSQSALPLTTLSPGITNTNAPTRWLDVVVTFESGTHRYFCNGVNVGSVTPGGSFGTNYVTPRNNLVIGGQPFFNTSNAQSEINFTAPTYAFVGRLSNIMLWSRVLRDDEIRQLYAAPYAMFN